MKIEKYWDINFENRNIDSYNEKIFKKLDNLISESVKLRMISDFPVNFLSGVDSSFNTFTCVVCQKNQSIHLL